MYIQTYTHLCSIDEDDAVGAEGHSSEESKQLLQRVSVGLREKETEVPQGITTQCWRGQLWRGRGRKGGIHQLVVY